MKYGEVKWGQQEALLNKIGGIEGMNKILSGEWIVGEPAKVSKPKRSAKKTDTAIDTIIRIDRAAAVPYPDWVKDVLHPAIERNAPAEYDLANLPPLWLHDGQNDGKYVKGQIIYDYLTENRMLDNCLSLSDGLAIQQKGVAVFRKVFGNNYVFLWGSVVRGRYGYLGVPCVCVSDGEVVVHWYWLDSDWSGGNPAARFAS